MTEQLPHHENFDDLLPDIVFDSSESNHASGTLTAEAVGYTALSRELLSTKELGAWPSFKKAWSVIELGLTAPSHKTRQGFLSIAEERLNMILDDQAAPDALRMRTIIASVAMPSFRVRAEQEPLTESLQHVTYHRHIRLLSNEVNRDIYQGKGAMSGQKGLALGILCESLTYAMLLKSGDPALFPFPAAPREDQSDHVDQNHDLYISYRDTKIPIQVKRSKGALSNDDIVGVNLLSHIKPAISRSLNCEKSQRITWTKHFRELEPDVMLARYLAPNNPDYGLQSRSLSQQVIDNVSQSVSATVRTQMADIIRRKGLGVSSTDDLV